MDGLTTRWSPETLENLRVACEQYRTRSIAEVIRRATEWVLADPDRLRGALGDPRPLPQEQPK